MIQICILNSEHSEGNKIQYHGCAWVLPCLLPMGHSTSNIAQDMMGPYVKAWITIRF
jgi:hypothetical protein